MSIALGRIEDSMRKGMCAVAAGVVAVFVLSGCSGGSEPVAAAEESAVSSTTAAPMPELSPRGAIVKQIGEPAGVKGGYWDGVKSVEFILTDVTPDPVCETQDERTVPKNGRHVLLDFEIETFAGVPVRPILGKYDFYSVTADGYIGEVGETQGDLCVKEASWDGVYEPKPNSKYHVTLLLDVPADTVAVGYDWDESTAWEWELPAG
ncbi:hypothetical protein QNA24_30165 [Rhodococcus qingshengii]|uniref:hypothetical protein n=1 Tax=Rhodococcus TaxID=1827 RepID=UPI001E5E3111|nr:MULTISPECIES: hypothetical protein [Rhodococcus]MCD2099515.1 hypothetical protein [Rhodococcus rhodochrous]MCQ4136690.1 hypothetical protein [Rhodococcus rhodochrous]MDJ0490649.1 hypothetical protein [Rhodococcus qingshengii]